MSSENYPSYSLPVRVYFEDTDAGGIVYHANYLKFMERARTEWLRELGFEQDDLKQQHGVIFVVRNINLEYHKPALFNDQLRATVEIREVGKSSFTCKQFIYKLLDNGEELLVNEADVILVCIDAEKLRPKRIPPAIVEALQTN